MLTPWPDQFWRYLAPLTPLSWLFLLLALDAAARWLSRPGEALPRGRWSPPRPSLALLLVQVVIAAGFLHGLQPVSYYAADGTRAAGTAPHLRAGMARARSGVRVRAAPRPAGGHRRLVGAASRLPPHRPARGSAAARAGTRTLAARYLDAVPVSYLVLDELGLPGISERYAAPSSASHPDAWRLAYTTPGTGVRVYERVR